jgi:hypothetical protein
MVHQPTSLPPLIPKWGATANRLRAKSGYNTSWSTFNEDGKITRILDHEPCFSYLWHKPEVVFKSPYFVSCAYMPQGESGISRQDAIDYIGFLTDPVRSPWKDILGHLCVSDTDWIAEHGYVFSDLPKIDRKLFYCFLIATRKPWEQPETLKAAIDFQTYGFSEREAHFLSHVWYGENKDGFVLGAPSHSFMDDENRKLGAYRFINQCPRLLGTNAGGVYPSSMVWYAHDNINHERYRTPSYGDMGFAMRRYSVEEIRTYLNTWLEAQETCHKTETNKG